MNINRKRSKWVGRYEDREIERQRDCPAPGGGSLKEHGDYMRFLAQDEKMNREYIIKLRLTPWALLPFLVGVLSAAAAIRKFPHK